MTLFFAHFDPEELKIGMQAHSLLSCSLLVGCVTCGVGRKRRESEKSLSQPPQAPSSSPRNRQEPGCRLLGTGLLGTFEGTSVRVEVLLGVGAGTWKAHGR